MPRECSLQWLHCSRPADLKWLRLSMCRKGKLKEARCELQKLIKDGNNSIEHYTQINTVSKEIETLCDEIIAGSKIRAKVQFLETNEKPTRYFLHREKK